MSDYQKLFSELRYEVWKVSFLNAFLNAALAFFICNIVMTLFNGRFIYSLVPAAIVFLWSFFRKVRQYTLKRIEEGNPEVSEILRTANDNSTRDELMVHALFMELMQKMETVTTGVLINARRTVFKIVVIAVLAFIPVVITSFTPFLIMNNPLAGLSIQNLIPGHQTLAPTNPIADATNRDIYGNKDIMNLGNQKLDITAVSTPGGVDFTKSGDATGNQFTYNDYPVQPSAQQTEAGTGGGNTADSALINDYSCKTKGTC